MGFEVYFDGYHYPYGSLETVKIDVTKKDLQGGNMLEHTKIVIKTREPKKTDTSISKEDLINLVKAYVRSQLGGLGDGHKTDVKNAREREIELFGLMRKICGA